MRIRGERLRYAMELLAGAFDRSQFEEPYAVLKQDHATAQTTFSKWLQHTECSGVRAELAGLIASEEKHLDQACRQFRIRWKTERIDDRVGSQSAEQLRTNVDGG